VAAAARKPLTRGSLTLQPCVASEGATQAFCGSFSVYENRASHAGRKLALNLVILPALAEKSAPDAVFAFGGGPGQSAADVYPLTSFIQALRRERDIVRSTSAAPASRTPFSASSITTMRNF
jgi:hypothetical protein